jgi:hypothetical protein
VPVNFLVDGAQQSQPGGLPGGPRPPS